MKKLALFFYKGSLSSLQAATVRNYFLNGGYSTVGFRKISDGYVPTNDVIEFNFSIAAGEVPATYDRFKTSSTQIVDLTPTSDILAENKSKPPTENAKVTSTAAGATVSAPTDASL